MTFFEELPEKCPPSDAIDDDLGTAWRLIRNTRVSDNDFLSHAALGKVNNAVDSCRWASCSLFTTESAATAKTKLPNLKGCKPVQVEIGKGSGMWLQKGTHVDFWRYHDFNPLDNIISPKVS